MRIAKISLWRGCSQIALLANLAEVPETAALVIVSFRKQKAAPDFQLACSQSVRSRKVRELRAARLTEARADSNRITNGPDR
jgi:hypothetical protein